MSSRDPKQLSPAGTKLAVSIICLSFVAVGLGLWIPWFLLPTLDWYQMRTWKSAPCTIVKSPAGTGDAHGIHVVYRYEWDGVSYDSDKVGTGGLFAMMSEAELWSVPPGTTRTCWVNPRDARQASLNRDYDSETLLGCIPLIFVILPLAGLIAGWRNIGKPPEAPPPPLPALREGALTIERTPRGGCGVVAILVMILVTGGLSAGLALILGPKAGFFAYVYAVPFGLIALLLIRTLFAMTLASFNPKVALTLTPGQVAPGQTLELRWETEGNVARAKSFRITLEGRESEKRHKWTKIEVFSTTEVFKAGSRDLRRGLLKVRIPESGMHSLTHGSRKIAWVFRIDAECPRWPRAGEEYEFEVLPGEGGSAMSSFSIEFPEPKPALRPGDTLSGDAVWSLSEPAASLKLKLVWTTDGQGSDADPVTAEEQIIDQPATEGRKSFSFTLPEGPWSFEGNLFTLEWYVEFGDSEYRYKRGEFVLSPSRAPVRVRKDSPAEEPLS